MEVAIETARDENSFAVVVVVVVVVVVAVVA